MQAQGDVCGMEWHTAPCLPQCEVKADSGRYGLFQELVTTQARILRDLRSFM